MKKLEKNLTEMISFSKTNRELMKQYYLIEKARDFKIFNRQNVSGKMWVNSFYWIKMMIYMSRDQSVTNPV